MKVRNVEAEVRFRYNEAAEAKEEGSKGYTDSSETSGGIGTFINKAATGAGLLTQVSELSHLVSFIR